MNDKVNHPAHYTQGGIECIDALEAALTREEFIGFCKGNAIKYLWRSRYKGATSEDYQKSIWYATRADKTINTAPAPPPPLKK